MRTVLEGVEQLQRQGLLHRQRLKGVQGVNKGLEAIVQAQVGPALSEWVVEDQLCSTRQAVQDVNKGLVAIVLY